MSTTVTQNPAAFLLLEKTLHSTATKPPGGKRNKALVAFKTCVCRPPLGQRPESVSAEVATEFVKTFLPKVWRVLKSEGMEKRSMSRFRAKLADVKK